MNLAGTSAVVTGGTEGIGRAVAHELLKGGASVTVVGRRPEALSKAENEGFTTIRADLSSSLGCDVMLAVLRDRPIDILVNNAGVDPVFNIDQAIDRDAIDQAIFLNLNAPIHLIAGLLKGLRARPSASIVNVTSGLAIAPSADTPVYCATKAGLRSFTMALRAQLARSNVTVIEALPPMVDTAMTRAIANASKISATDCAVAIVDAIVRDRPEAYIGQVKLLRRIYSLSPAFARKIVLRS